ncbi:PREDICTED: taste receptor type 2 member 10-like [Chrysochloris asiatica]|uniref:Taste receptor type 2 n=1 Tax=Chrysochloris asiatica TaxID=185453 RepID=A0A9B0TIS2_CHRAS|nr:PREDICTED: taste receptor type 2 member 10-like [Chrysochloris asiatica]
MLSVTEDILIFIVVCETVLGSLGNGFIGLVNCIECVKNKKFSVIGFILAGLAVSRSFLIWILVIDGFLKTFFPDFYVSSGLIECISYLWIIINQSSLWFATSLNIFYFLKIANFSHHIFVWLKSGPKRVLLFLTGSLLISWLLSFPQTVKIINGHKAQNGSRAWHLNMHKTDYFFSQILVNLGVIFLFTVSLIACFLIIISLWRHNRRMQLNATGFRDPSTDAYMRATKMLMSFMVLLILYFVGITIEVSCFVLPEEKLLFLFGLSVTLIYPWGHSFILILGNSKLKQTSLRVLQQLKCYKKRKKSQCSVAMFGEK